MTFPKSGQDTPHNQEISKNQDRTGQDRTGQDRTGQDGTGSDRTAEIKKSKNQDKTSFPKIRVGRDS